MQSPLSQSPPQKVRNLSREFLRAQLADYFQASPPDDIVAADYELWRCSETGLEFCHPPQPGNAEFYEWISRHARYYPEFRWEYGEVARLLLTEKRHPADFKVLDVGCGKGDFLQALKFLPAQNKYALDLNEPAIRACRALGFNAFCGTVETAIAGGFLKPAEFPVVTAFHCLEHVSQPVEFVRELLRATAPGGKLYLSTPYSPMSFEQDWFDVLNHPPHHMTRWNLAAYRRLAKILKVEMRHFTPRCRPVKQAWQSFCLNHFGPHAKVSKPVRFKKLLRQLPQFLSHWRRLKSRVRQHDAGGADLVLVEFRVP